MIDSETAVKGIILAVYPQGEYGKRISLLCDKYGKITVFAQGAAKQNSKLIGACRPFVCGEFTLAKGKTARNIHGISVIEAFEEIPLSADTVFTGTYFLELAEYFSQEGMAERDAKDQLNLLYVGLSELKMLAEKKTKLSELLIRRIFELKTLAQEGICPEAPPEGMEQCRPFWEYVSCSRLSGLYRKEVWGDNFGKQELETFTEAVRMTKNRLLEHRFKTEEYLDPS